MTAHTDTNDGTVHSPRPQLVVPSPFNIASYLPARAEATPDQTAVVMAGARGRSALDRITLTELEALSNRYANGLTGLGIERSMRVLMMVKPGIEFMGLTFALFKMGAVPVMIDPGMGVRRMLECIRGVDLQAFIGIPLAHVMRKLHAKSFATLRQTVTVGRRWFWSGPTLDKLERGASDSFTIAPTATDDVAAILFTSGSTGPAKGVVYEHGMFGAQVEQIQSFYGIESGEIDLPTFPLFGLFSVAMGMTAIIPDMDPSRPGHVDPRRIVEPICGYEVTNTFGSPALWKRVATYGVKNNVKLPTLKRILIAGAPVPYPVIEQLHQVMSPNADVHTPYGATESLPVSSISGREVLGNCRQHTRAGAGTCVGKPLPGIDLRFIRITDDPVPQWSEDLTVDDGEIGEIVVSGPVVTKEYFSLPEANETAKVIDGDRVWHRIGDVGYRDAEGRVWFCGRKAHGVLTRSGLMFTVRCEAIFNEHLDVARSALVGVGPRGSQNPVIVVELNSGRLPTGHQADRLREELLELARANKLTRPISQVLFHRSLPVDIRHNVKINREELALWAQRRLG